MDTSEVHVSSLTCMRLKRGTFLKKSDKPLLNRFEQAALLATTMLSDAHHLGLCVAVGACRGTPQLIATEPKECQFSAVFRPEK